VPRKKIWSKVSGVDGGRMDICYSIVSISTIWSNLLKLKLKCL